MSKAIVCTRCKNPDAIGPFSTTGPEDEWLCVACSLVTLRDALLQGCSITIGPPTVRSLVITGIKPEGAS